MRFFPAMFMSVALWSCNYNHPLNDEVGSDDGAAGLARSVSAEVIEYSPMPGQFINVTPSCVAGDTPESMARKATEYLKNGYAISLGAWGGSITLHLDEPIMHRPSGRDFRILGNAFYKNMSQASELKYGASEPGIIMVSADEDADGQPDCWYEIAGSEYDKSESPFSVTYKALASGDVSWSASDGSSGIIKPNQFHTQPYFPQWITGGELTVTGRRLPDNGYMLPSGSFTQRCFDYGYADNQPNSSDASIINLEWAVDSEGNSVELPSVCFIKIYTGVFQESQELGECSTEIIGVEIPAE